MIYIQGAFQTEFLLPPCSTFEVIKEKTKENTSSRIKYLKSNFPKITDDEFIYALQSLKYASIDIFFTKNTHYPLIIKRFEHIIKYFITDCKKLI